MEFNAKFPDFLNTNGLTKLFLRINSVIELSVCDVFYRKL